MLPLKVVRTAESLFEASKYDSWFLSNPYVLESEALLLKYLLEPSPGRALSVGCGSGLF